jgi:hypothetical protein
VRRLACTLAACAPLFSPFPASAQPAARGPITDGAGPLAWTYDGGFLRDLPTSDNLFALIETLQPSIVSDRFSGGGLNAGRPARIGGFLSSWTQTIFRVDGVPITDPTGNGAPMVFPELVFWDRVGVRTGLFRADSNAVGLAIDLTPRGPTDRWTSRAEGAVSHAALAGASGGSAETPALARLDGWDRATVIATGPIVPARVGAAFGVSIMRSSQFSRGEPFPANSSLASAFSHAVLKASDRDTVRVVGWIQQRKEPLRERDILGQPQAAAGHTGGHVQAVWQHEDTLPWRAHTSYSGRRQTPDFANATSGVTDRIADGPVSGLAALSRQTVETWSLGAGFFPTLVRRGRVHRLDTGVDLTGGGIESSAFFAGTIGELVDQTPARVWSFRRPTEAASLRHALTFGAFLTDRVAATRRLTLDLGVRYEAAAGSARGASRGISWQTWLPRAAARWDIDGRWQPVLVAGYGRSAHRLALDYLAVGDPAAPTADVFRWNALAGGTLPLTALGARIARVGPGTGGDPAFTQIDADLRRPTMDEIVLGIEARPRSDLLLRLTGIARTARHLPAVVDVGAPGSNAYVPFEVVEPGDVNRDGREQLLQVFNRQPASFGLDRYVLASPERENATFNGLEAAIQFNTTALTLIGGMTAGRATASAASRGIGPLENEDGPLGEILVNPNAEHLARGRPFTDRAYALKFAGVYRFPSEVRLGLIVRHQGGQPFAPVIVFPGLNQGAEAVRAAPNGETRFPAISTSDLRVQKAFLWRGRQLGAFADVFNLFGLSRTVEQRVNMTALYAATAIQPPRVIQIGLRVTF